MNDYSKPNKIPRSRENDYSREAAEARRRFLAEQTGAELNHVRQFSFEPSVLPGNIENFIGVAQVPIGLAGPLLVNGEYAKGEFFVPLATTEGTLVASYNRGMKLLRESGGVTTTVVDDAMQRAPVFVFKSAREARDFGVWVKENFAEIKATSRSDDQRPENCATSSNIRRAVFFICVLITRPATPPGKTWSGKRRKPPAIG